MEIDLSKKLDKLTHEYSKDISVTAANAIQIGAFPCNETGLSVIAIEIYGATTTASHCIAVLYANAVTNASTGTINWKVYNDYNNSIKDKLYLQRNTNNKINIYYKPAVAARLIFHVIATNLQDAPLNSDMFKSLALPNAASIKPDTNTLTDTFLKISGDTLTGNLTTNGDIILSEGRAVKTSESNFSGLKHLKTNTGAGSNLLLQGAQQMIVAAGEVGTDLYNNSLKGANSIPTDGEQLYLLSDREITIGAGYQSGAKVNKIVLNSVGTAIDNNVTVTGDVSVSGSFKGNLKGNADTASKFNTNKTITISGAVTGSVSSQDDWAITAERKSCVLGQNNINSTFTTDEQIKPWYKVASCSITTANTDVEVTFLVEDTYSSSNFGILKIRARYGNATNASNYIDTDKSMIKWLCNLGYDPNDFKLVLPTTKNPTVELWTRIATEWHCRRFTVISEGKRKDFDPSVWTLYTAISDGQQTSIPTAGTKKTSELPNFDLNNIQINNIELPTVGSFVGKSVKGSPETFSGLNFIEVYHTIDSTANPSVRTDNEKYGYSVLLQGANKLIVSAGEAGYKAFNSVMAGDNVIENDNVEDLHLLADNKVIIGTGYNTVSVGSNYTFDKNTLILPDKAIIRDNLSTNSWSGIKFVRKTSANNNGADVLVQGAGQLIISAGDHGEDIATGTLTNGNKTETIVSNHDENLYLVADKDIIVFSNIEQGIVNRKSFSFKQNGTFAIGTGGALTVPAATIDSASIPSANIKGNVTLKSNMYMPVGTRIGNSLNSASWSGMSLAAENANGLGSDIIIQGASKLIVAAGEAANNAYNNSNANSNSIPSNDNSENLYLLADKNVIIGSNYGNASLGVNATLDTSGALTVNRLNTAVEAATYLDAPKSGYAALNINGSGHTAIINAPTKTQRVALVVWPNSDDKVRLYSVHNDTLNKTVNSASIKTAELNWDASNGILTTDKLILNKAPNLSDTTRNESITPALVVGALSGNHLEFDENEIRAKSAWNKGKALYLNSEGGVDTDSGKVVIGSAGLSVKGGGIILDSGGITASSQTITADTFSGKLNGNALTANKLSTARALKVSLGNTSSVNFDGSAAVTTIGIGGTLPVANGGTGVNNLNNITVGGATRDCLGNVISSTYAKLAGSTFTGPVTFQKPIVLSNILNLSDSLRTSASTPALVIGTLSGNHLEFDNNEIRAKTKWNKGTTLFLNSGSGEESSQGGLVNVGNGGFNVSGNATIKDDLSVNNNVTINGTLHLTSTVDAGLGKATSPALIIGEGLNKQHIEIDGNEILSKSDNNTTSDLYINTSGDKGVVIGKGGLTIQGGGVLVDKQAITAQTFSGSLNGNALTASSLQTARALQVSLNKISSTNFQGNAAVTNIGVQGTLQPAQGGTGQTVLSAVAVGAATKATQDGSGNIITSTYLKQNSARSWYGKCETAGNVVAKTITISGFDSNKLVAGCIVTIILQIILQ